MRNLILATIAGLTVSAAANAAPAHYPLTAAVGGQPTAAEAVAIRRDLGSSFGKEWTDYEKTGHRIGFTVGHADLNGDGRPDLIVAGGRTGNAGNYLGANFNNGDGTFTTGAGFGDNSTQYYTAVAAADLNDDGRAEIVTGFPVGAEFAEIACFI